MSYKHPWDLDQCLPEMNLGKNVGIQSWGYMRCDNLACTVQTGFILSQTLNSDNIQFSQGFFSFVLYCCLVSLLWYLSSSQTSDLVPDQPLFFISCQKYTSFSRAQNIPLMHFCNLFMESEAFMQQIQSWCYISCSVILYIIFYGKSIVYQRGKFQILGGVKESTHPFPPPHYSHRTTSLSRWSLSPQILTCLNKLFRALGLEFTTYWE